MRCQLPPSTANGSSSSSSSRFQVPSSGVLGVHTLLSSGSNQSVEVGIDFGSRSGFARVPAALAAATNRSRTDRAPLSGALGGRLDPRGLIELQVFLDGDRLETFFLGGEASITTVTSNVVISSAVSSHFVNTADLTCNVSSWKLGLPG